MSSIVTHATTDFCSNFLFLFPGLVHPGYVILTICLYVRNYRLLQTHYYHYFFHQCVCSVFYLPCHGFILMVQLKSQRTLNKTERICVAMDHRSVSNPGPLQQGHSLCVVGAHFTQVSYCCTPQSYCLLYFIYYKVNVDGII